MRIYKFISFFVLSILTRRKKRNYSTVQWILSLHLVDVVTFLQQKYKMRRLLMRIINLNHLDDKPMRKYNSKRTSIIPILTSIDEIQFVVMNIKPFGIIGMHKATDDQLFIVAKGEGWVRNETSGKISLKEGECVYWKEGEEHESGSDNGMMVYILEGIDFSIKA